MRFGVFTDQGLLNEPSPLGDVLNRGEKAKVVRIGFAWEGLVLKRVFDLAVTLLNGYRSIVKMIKRLTWALAGASP